MRIFDAPWINHDGGGIFSVDIHSSGKKLVTAGQDISGAGLLMIWPINFLSEEYEDTAQGKNHLARIPHSKSVNCARWSRRDGRRLVCAGDDAVICVYECVGSFMTMGMMGANKLEQGKTQMLENYRCIHRLYGHSTDVLHVDWSPDERFIASCSLDSSIIVWNAERLPERITTLKQSNNGHSRGVKGLAWDPMGRFLATQAEDNSLKLWQTDSWECVRTIDEPYQESAGSTLFLRMDWSPDGMYLVSPCAMNNGGPTANILARKDWSHQRDFVGFRKAVSCVRANQRCFSREVNENGECSIVSYFATGCRDRSLAVWIVPSFGRPLLVMEKFFKLSILDISWNDMTLAACSSDGVVRFLNFTESEVGVPLSSGEMMSLSEKIYGFLPDVYRNNTAASTTTVSTTGSPQKPLLDDNFIFSAWHEAFSNSANKQRAPLSFGDNCNIFQMKRKISSSYLRRMVTRIKRQRRLDNHHPRIKKEEPSENIAMASTSDKFLQDDRLLFERSVRSSSSTVFLLPELHPQLHAKTLHWSREGKIRYVTVLNNYSIGLNRSSTDFKNASSQNEIVTKISAFDDTSERWSIYTAEVVSAIASNSFWTCYVTYNGRFFCNSTQTGRLIFSLAFHSPMTRLILNGSTCILISCDGNLIKCNLKYRRCFTKSLLSLFRSEAHQLILQLKNDQAVVSTGDLNQFIVGDNDMDSVWDLPLEEPILELLRTNLYPLPHFTSFILSKEERNILLGEPLVHSMDDLDMEKMAQCLCSRIIKCEANGSDQIASDVTFSLLDILQYAIEQNTESEARFAVSLIMLRLIRNGDVSELMKFSQHLKTCTKFDGILYKHFANLLTEFYHCHLQLNQEDIDSSNQSHTCVP